MEWSLRVSGEHARTASHSTVSSADGLASIYAARVLERGVDPRALCAEIRADRLGFVDRGPQRRALMARTRTSRFGRGTAAHLRSQTIPSQPPRPHKAPGLRRPDRATSQIAKPPLG